jgi:Sulfotransferase family
VATGLLSERTPGTRPGPLAIGGVGGSGTRVVAEIVRRLGFHLGADLNQMLDNLWFTMLFRRPAWYARASRRRGHGIHANLDALDRAMTSRLLLRDAPLVIGAAADLAWRGQGRSGAASGWRWSVDRARAMLGAPRFDPSRQRGWGWKEPNTHIYLPELTLHFPALRYVHVIRHGYEVACGRNQTQLYNWGRLYGVEPPRDDQEIPAASLTYWALSNLRAIELGERLGERFLLLDYNRLCASPRESVDELLAFLECEADETERETLAALPDASRAQSRSSRFDGASFRPQDVETLASLGYDPAFRPA